MICIPFTFGTTPQDFPSVLTTEAKRMVSAGFGKGCETTWQQLCMKYPCRIAVLPLLLPIPCDKLSPAIIPSLTLINIICCLHTHIFKNFRFVYSFDSIILAMRLFQTVLKFLMNRLSKSIKLSCRFFRSDSKDHLYTSRNLWIMIYLKPLPLIDWITSAFVKPCHQYDIP